MLYLCTRKRQGIACRRSSAVEHVICNLGVGGPNPSAGSKKRGRKFRPLFLFSEFIALVFPRLFYKQIKKVAKHQLCDSATLSL